MNESSPESPAKEQPGEQNAAPQVPEPSPFGEVSHHKPAVAAPDVAAMVKRLREIADEFEMDNGRVRDACRDAAALIEKLGQSWIPMTERLPHFTKEGGDPPVLIYSPKLAADADFPGHAIEVSNPEYVACGNAVKNGYTHWMPLPPPPERP